MVAAGESKVSASCVNYMHCQGTQGGCSFDPPFPWQYLILFAFSVSDWMTGCPVCPTIPTAWIRSRIEQLADVGFQKKAVYQYGCRGCYSARQRLAVFGAMHDLQE
jgi:hypothetical protein